MEREQEGREGVLVWCVVCVVAAYVGGSDKALEVLAEFEEQCTGGLQQAVRHFMVFCFFSALRPYIS